MPQTTLNIKPLSINIAYRGRRFKSKEYIQYKQDLLLLLPKLKVPAGKIEISYLWGVSNKRSDCDNLIKVFTDILQEAYEFDDCRIYRIVSEKKDIPKGHEFISFTIGKFYG